MSEAHNARTERGSTAGDYPQRLDEVTESLTAVYASLADEEDLDAVLDRLAQTAVRAIPEADVVSVTVLTDGGHSRTAAATDERVLALEEQQRGGGPSPAGESAQQRHPVRVGTEHDSGMRWPGFTAAASEAGVAAYLSAPVFLDDPKRLSGQDPTAESEMLGWLNLYSDTAEAFDPFDEALLRLLTTSVSAALSAARRYHRTREEIASLERALGSRAEIDQAKGVLMAAHGIDADTAFARLVERSQHSNTKLVTVARQLLESLQDR